MENTKIIYLSGKITGNKNYKEEFQTAEDFLESFGHIVLNPARLDEIVEGLTYEQYMSICYRLIDVSDVIFMVGGWKKSKGANAELSYARSLGKKVMYQDYFRPFRKENKENENSQESDL